MITYAEYLRLSQSRDSEERGQAAHFAAYAFISHRGPADEQAALYAAVINFLDDPSVKVRAALAYGLLHSDQAPRPVVLALLQDAPVIARAVAQYSPVLLDADLVPLIREADASVLRSIAARTSLGTGAARAILETSDRQAKLTVLEQTDLALPESVLRPLIAEAENDAELRGLLLARKDVRGALRLDLVEQVRTALTGARMVRGAVAPSRLARLMRDLGDTAITGIGEVESQSDDGWFAASQIAAGRLNARMLLHALINGHVAFFAAALGQLSDMPADKISTILAQGNRSALQAILARAGLAQGVMPLFVRLIQHARVTDLADDLASRYFIVTVLIEELIASHPDGIPASLTAIFAYLNDQNIILARRAARGVLKAFAEENEPGRPLPLPQERRQLRLSAA